MVSVSKMTGKLEGIDGISTNPLDNDFCNRQCKTDTICKYCYSRKMVSTYRKSAAAAWTRNGIELSYDLIEKYPKLKKELVRLHPHGELINQTHFINFCRIAEHFPDKTFALWTKRAEIINSGWRGHVPSNLILIYSNPKIDAIMDTPPEGFDKVFNVVTTDTDVNCGSKKCIDCKQCYAKNNGVNCIIEKLKK